MQNLIRAVLPIEADFELNSWGSFTNFLVLLHFEMKGVVFCQTR